MGKEGRGGMVSRFAFGVADLGQVTRVDLGSRPDALFNGTVFTSRVRCPLEKFSGGHVLRNCTASCSCCCYVENATIPIYVFIP